MQRRLFSLLHFKKHYSQFKKKRKGVYHYHIRKTGGTSLNKALINAFTRLDSDEGYDKLMKEKDLRLICSDNVVIAHNKFLLEKGNFDFGFAHLPFHRLNIPADIKKVTCLRDPVKRVISHYKMIDEYARDENRYREDYEREKEWMKDSALDFVKNMPVSHRERQLYMFSENFDITEALQNLETLDCVVFLDEFDEGVARLGEIIGKEIPVYHKRKSSRKIEYDYNKVERILSREVKFYEAAKKCYKIIK